MKKTTKILIIAISLIVLLGGGSFLGYTIVKNSGDSSSKTYTVSFNSMGGTAVASLTGIKKNSKIDPPTQPTRTAYNFAGWYKEEALVNPWNFETDTVTRYTILYARWDATTVNFLTEAELPAGRYLTEYDVNLVTTSNDEPVTYALKQDAIMPAGLSLDAEGHITGTIESSPEIYRFAIIATSKTGATHEREFNIRVGRKQLIKPTLVTNSFVYDWDSVSVELDIESTDYTLGGAITRTSAGEYVATVTLADTSRYEWSDDATDSALILPWKIERGRIARPRLAVASFKYNGAERAVELYLQGYDSRVATLIELIGQVRQTTYGDYTAVVVLSDEAKQNWLWTNQLGYEDDIDEWYGLAWTITDLRGEVIKPTLPQSTYTYTGSPITPLSNAQGFTVTGDTTMTNVGNYTITVSISDPFEFTWIDGTTDPFTLNWSIIPARVARPTITPNNFVYDGTEKTINVQTTAAYTVTGTRSASDAGTYTITVTLSPNHRWTNGNETEVLSLNWTIARKEIAKPTLSQNSFVYNGSEVDIRNYIDAHAGYTFGGNTTATNAGNYTLSVTLTENYSWIGGTREVHNLSWSIARQGVARPVISPYYFEYDGTAKTINVDSTAMYTVTGTRSATNAGSYSITVTLNSNYQWTTGNATEVLNLSWSITRKAIARPTITPNNFTYDNSPKTVNVATQTGVYTVGGTRTATNAGNYSITVTLNSNYQWNSAPATEVLTLPWTISRQEIAKPSLSTSSFVYSGSEVSITNYIAAHAGYTFDGDMTGTNADDYILTVVLTSNYAWTGGSRTDHNLPWTIARAGIDRPTITDTFVYDGTRKDITLVSVPGLYTVTGTTYATLAGTYTVTVTPDSNHQWNTGTPVEAFTLPWTIQRQSIARPEIIPNNFSYDGNPKTINVNSTAQYIVAGTRTATAIGVYEITVTLTANYQWNDGIDRTRVLTLTWAIGDNRTRIPVPTPQTSFEYNGSTHTPLVAGSGFSVGGQTSATNAGSYTVTATIINPFTHTWADGSTDDIVINWEITRQAVVRPVISPSNFTYDATPKTINVDTTEKYVVLGTRTATNPGTYQISVALTANYRWSTGNPTEILELTWSIGDERERITKPTIQTTYIYNGNPHTPLANGTGFTVSGDVTKTNAGSYMITVSISNPVLYTWADGTTDPFELSWVITRQAVARPVISPNTFEYDGTEKTINVNTTTAYVVAGTRSATNNGSYSITVTLNSNYQWSTGTLVEQLNLTWTITKKAVTRPVISPNTFVYDGLQKTINVNTVAGQYTVTGTRSETDAGTYAITVTLDSNHQWSTGINTTEVLNLTWTITRQTVARPVIDPANFVFDNTPHTINVDSTAQYTVTGTRSATAAGTYEITVTLDANYQWSTGSNTTETLTLYWSIGRQTVARPVISPNSFVFNNTQRTINVATTTEYTVTGARFATNVGNYSITVTLNADYQWSTGPNTTETLTLTWSITRQQIDRPTLSQNSFVYNGSLVDIRNYVVHTNAAGYTFSGTQTATAANNYSLTVNLGSNYAWTGGATTAHSLPWSITRALVARPVISPDTFEYDGVQKTINVNTVTGQYTVTGTRYATDAGTYSVIVTLNSNYQWSTGANTTAALNLSWTITRQGVTRPVISPNFFIYDNTEKTINVSSTLQYSVTGTRSATDPGLYSIEVTLYSNYQWSTGDPSEILTLNWSINDNRTRIEKPAPQLTYVYDGNPKTPLANGTGYTVSGQTTMTNVGTYLITVSISDPLLYTWVDGTTASFNLNWSITRQPIARPVISPNTFVYDGTEKTINVNSTTGYTITAGTRSATNAGSYSITVTLNSNYQWSTGPNTTEVITLPWTITRALVARPVIFPNTFEYDGTQKTINVDTVPGQYTVAGTRFATSAGSYAITVTLNPNYQWSTGTAVQQLNLSWTITKKAIVRPVIHPNTFEYDATQKTINVDTVSGQYTVTGARSATDAGTYSITVTLNSNYQWSTGTNTTETLNLSWAITRQLVARPVIDPNTFEFNNAIRTINVDTTDAYVVTGARSAIDFGTYNIVVTLNSNYQWSTGSNTTEILNLSWTITRQEIAKPTLSTNSFVYSGSAVNILSHINTHPGYSFGGNTTGTNAGSYSLSVTLGSNYSWLGGTREVLALPWSITRQGIARPVISPVNFTYDGTQKTINVNTVAGQYTVTGTRYATEPGQYSIFVELNANYQWSTGTPVEILTLNWSIGDERTQIQKPTPTLTFEYTGNPITPLTNGTGYTVSGDTTKTIVGNYSITITISNSLLFTWTDGTTDPFTLNWSITRQKIARPTITDNFVFNNSAQTITLNTTAMYTVGGTTTATNAGTYQATVTLNSNYQWSTGNATEQLALSWSIARQAIARPVISPNDFTYNGNTHTINVDTVIGQYTVAGTRSASNLGVYAITVTLNSNYQWSTGPNTTEQLTLNWTITDRRTTITKPTLAQSSFVYTGLPIIPLANGTGYTVSGDTSKTDVGSYSITVSISDPVQFTWLDGTTESFILNWSITRLGIARPTIFPETFTFNGSQQTINVNTVTGVYEVTGARSATDAGTYNINVTLSPNHQWNTGTALETLTLTWTILPQQLTAPTNLNINGKTLTWAANTNATNYSVEIDGVLQSATSGNTYMLDSLTEPKDYEIRVRANGAGNYSDSPFSASTYYRVTATLTAPSGIQLDGETLKWNTVTNAINYTVNINGITYTANTTSFLLTNFTTTPNTYNISIRSNGDGTFYLNSAFSAPAFVVTRPSAPANVSISNNMLTWTTVGGFTYDIYLNGTLVEAGRSTSGYVIPTTLPVGSNTYNVAVASAANRLVSAQSSVNITRLAAPTNLAVNDHVLTWNAVAGATSYRITAGATTFDVEGSVTRFDLFARLSVANYTLTVTAIGNGSTNLTSPASSGLSYSVTIAIIGITTEEQLNNVRSNLSANYALLNDIALTAPWNPIMGFTGTFYGRGRTISSLALTTSSTAGSGLFGTLSGMVQDLTVIADIKASYAGGIAGRSTGTIINCEVFGSIGELSNSYVGGIVGLHTGGSFTNNTNHANVFGTSNIGGIVGAIEWERGSARSLTNCVNNGIINIGGGSNAGGIVGSITIASSGGSDSSVTHTITGCVNNAIVAMVGTGSNVGGIVGSITSVTNNAFNISECTNYGNITGTDFVAGILGRRITVTVSGINNVNHGAITASTGNWWVTWQP